MTIIWILNLVTVACSCRHTVRFKLFRGHNQLQLSALPQGKLILHFEKHRRSFCYSIMVVSMCVLCIVLTYFQYERLRVGSIIKLLSFYLGGGYWDSYPGPWLGHARQVLHCGATSLASVIFYACVFLKHPMLYTTKHRRGVMTILPCLTGRRDPLENRPC